jgi:hypothetical protein
MKLRLPAYANRDCETDRVGIFTQARDLLEGIRLFAFAKRCSERNGVCRIHSRVLGYPIDATDPYGWCFGLVVPPTRV